MTAPPQERPRGAAGNRAAPPKTGEMRHGILWMLLATLLFVTTDVCAKYLTQHYPIAQVMWGRFFFHLLAVILLLNHRLPALLRSARLKLQLGRSLVLVLTTVCFFTGLSRIPLAEASAILLVGPLLVTALSVPLLGERVGPRRWASVAIGFLGALIIIRPGSEVFQPAALFPLAAACFYSLYQIATRALAGVDRPLTTLLYTAIGGALLSSLLAPLDWRAPDAFGWALMISVGCLGSVSQFCLIKAFEAAPAAVITPFGYSNILWAIAMGYLVFGDLPGRSTLLGALVLIASGLYIFHREQLRTRQTGSG